MDIKDLGFIAIVLIILVVLWFSVKKIVYGVFGTKTKKGACCPFCNSNNSILAGPKVKLETPENPWTKVWGVALWGRDFRGDWGKIQNIHVWLCKNCGKEFQL
jgi:hypothetical protein